MPPIYSPLLASGFESDPVFLLWLSTVFGIPTSGSLTRDGNGYIATITNGTTTLTITRDGNNLISSVTNGTWILTINRSGGYITSWSVA